MATRCCGGHPVKPSLGPCSQWRGWFTKCVHLPGPVPLASHWSDWSVSSQTLVLQSQQVLHTLVSVSGQLYPKMGGELGGRCTSIDNRGHSIEQLDMTPISKLKVILCRKESHNPGLKYLDQTTLAKSIWALRSAKISQPKSIWPKETLIKVTWSKYLGENHMG